MSTVPPDRTALTLTAAPAERCADACCTPVIGTDPGWVRAAARARALSWVSLLWMTGEGVVGLIVGVQAGSISLLGWALGSVIEGLASMIVIWRFTGTRTVSDTAEARAHASPPVPRRSGSPTATGAPRTWAGCSSSP